MFSHKLDQTTSKIVILHWFLLSFNAGCINAGGFIATGRFVSHVTGFATLFGVALADQKLRVALGLVSVPVFFLLGNFIAGLMIDRPLYRGKAAHFDYVMGLSAFCLFLAAWGGLTSRFGGFGEDALISKYLLLCLLCLACGLQNAAITSSSGSSIRTTHLTGLTTDLGLGLARLFIFRKGEEKFALEVRANELRFGSIVSFVLGSAVGSWFFVTLGYKGFAISGCISLYAALHGRRAKIAMRVKLNP